MVRLKTRSEIAKAIFGVRSFKGRSPEAIRRRFQLATGIIRDVSKGKITLKTGLKLAVEAYDTITESTFVTRRPRTDVRRRGRALGTVRSARAAAQNLPRKPRVPPPPRFIPDTHNTGHTATRRGRRRNF